MSEAIRSIEQLKSQMEKYVDIINRMMDLAVDITGSRRKFTEQEDDVNIHLEKIASMHNYNILIPILEENIFKGAKTRKVREVVAGIFLYVAELAKYIKDLDIRELHIEHTVNAQLRQHLVDMINYLRALQSDETREAKAVAKSIEDHLKEAFRWGYRRNNFPKGL